MHTPLSFVLGATLLLLGLVSAVPTPEASFSRLNRYRQHKVQRVHAGIKAKDGPKAIRAAYSKFGWTLPSEDFATGATLSTSTVSDSVNTSGQTGTDSNHPTSYDTEYLAPVTIGGQTILMDFDTGSSDFWVMNDKTPATQTKGHQIFDSTKSATFKLMPGSNFSISYGDGAAAQGIVGTDTVNIGGATVTSQAVELATAVSAEFARNPQTNGLLGMGFSSINTVSPNQVKTFFDNVSPTLALPVFTANLKHATTGAYEFGFIDQSQFLGQIAYTPVDPSQGFWQFSSSSFSINGDPVEPNLEASPAIADTGTSLLFVDPSVATAFYKKVPGAVTVNQAGGTIFPCDSNLPDIQLAMGDGYMGTIPGTGLSYAPINGTHCLGALQSNSGSGLQIFGDIMFKAQFVVFDNGAMQIGFAPHAK